MCCCSRTVYPALDSPAIEGKSLSECFYQNVQLRRLTRVFARRTKHFVKPRDCRRYIRLAKALIRVLMCRLRVCGLIRLFVHDIVGFAMHRPMRDLSVQTITPNTLAKIFNRRHFEIFFSFFQENKICISFKLSPLHECQICFLGNKRKITIFFVLFFFCCFFFLSSAELAQIVVIRYPRAPSVVSLSKTLCPRNLVLVSNQEDSA